MIDIIEPSMFNICGACLIKDGTVKEIVFGNGAIRPTISLCKKCRKELVKKLKEAGEHE